MSGGMGGGEAGVDVEMLTTKGDTHGFDTDNARVPIGANNQVLTADSTEALGLKWATPTDIAPPTTIKGDLSGFSTLQARIPIGSNNQVLTADSTQALGLKWAAAAAGGKLELLDSHTATSTVGTYTFTPASALDMVNDYSSIIIKYSFHHTSVISAALVRINGNTTNYGNLGYRTNGTTMTQVVGQSDGMQLFTAGLTSPDGGTGGTMEFLYNISGGGNTKQVKMFSRSYGDSIHRPFEQFGGNCTDTSSDSITSIEILLTLANYEAGTQFDIYGVQM